VAVVRADRESHPTAKVLANTPAVFGAMGIGAASLGICGSIAVVGQGLQYRVPEAAL
jgi:hypothetical protein